ncbi:MAG TPA: class I SAM-dependent methyltransferase [Conexivisphaerales archaeon]|nr:class I SAM-dependent methyltransferase [Conexivisphaerales archaeon]
MDKITWRDIPGWFDFEDVYTEAVERAPASGARFVEVGVMFGRSAVYMASEIHRSKKHIYFDAVDPLFIPHHKIVEFYSPSVHSPSSWCPPIAEEAAREEVMRLSSPIGQRNVTESFIARSGLSDYINLIVRRGQDQASCYADESLDFVFIDTIHTYEDTREQLLAYMPKVKVGGHLGIHDFEIGFSGEDQAIAELLEPGSYEVRKYTCLWNKR